MLAEVVERDIVGAADVAALELAGGAYVQYPGIGAGDGEVGELGGGKKLGRASRPGSG